jgi:hypothetical protein
MFGPLRIKAALLFGLGAVRAGKQSCGPLIVRISVPLEMCAAVEDHLPWAVAPESGEGWLLFRR